METATEPATRFSVPLAWCYLLCLLLPLMLLRAWLVPRRSGSPDAAWPTPPAFVVDINTASQAEMQALPEIGPALAKRIVDYRQAHGRFERLEELQAVRGFGPKTYEQLRPMLSVGAAP